LAPQFVRVLGGVADVDDQDAVAGPEDAQRSGGEEAADDAGGIEAVVGPVRNAARRRGYVGKGFPR
jgi:hypothetical protein